MTDDGDTGFTTPVEQQDAVRLATGRLVGADHVDDISQPDIGDLASRLRFALKEGRIWLDTQRVALIHLSTLNSLRRELIDSLGTEKARGFLTRMGYASGARDAALARKIRPHHSVRETFLVGPQLRILQGVSAPEPLALEIDVSAGRFYGDFSWPESFEADFHASAYGISKTPVCWMQIGYLSGYASGFLGKNVLFKEVECRAMGAHRCRMVGKPVEAWPEAGRHGIEEDLRALQPEDFANRFERRAVASPSAANNDFRRDMPGLSADLVGASAGFVATCHLIRKVAGTNATTLFFGETGVGKEKFARTLHRASKRREKPFIAVNCAAIPETLIESELFGVEKGAYTGAVASRPGRFERADGGTLFLDEVRTLSMPAQIKLLRAIQEKEIERVGGVRTISIDVRIIAATNANLREAVDDGTFRNDLLFRLNVFPIHIPPLRERRDDIPLLMDHFLRRFTVMHGKKVTGFTARAVDALYEFTYPGNIRELENMIERAVILTDDGEPVDLVHLFTADDEIPSRMLKLDGSGELRANEGGQGDQDEPGGNRLPLIESLFAGEKSLDDMEGEILVRAVKRSNGNLSAAARLLGMTRPQLAYRLNKRKNTQDSG